MCGRFYLDIDPEELIEYFDLDPGTDPGPITQSRYNIAPSQEIAIVRRRAQGRALCPARWGLVPHWSKVPSTQYSTINARAESLADKPTYRGPFRTRRCLIPVSGFYEWVTTDGVKMPHLVHRADNRMIAFAGLWDRWEGDTPGFDSCSIIVTRANTQMSRIHHRMPVILEQQQFSAWLGNGTAQETLLGMLTPYEGELEIYPVSRYVNSPANSGPACIERLAR